MNKKVTVIFVLLILFVFLFSFASALFEKGNATHSSVSDLYSYTGEDVKASTGGFKQISLGRANFSAGESDNSSQRTFSLYLDDVEILSENVSIQNSTHTIISVSPGRTTVRIPTRFFANVISSDPSKSLTYLWEFGDNSNKTTYSNSTEHTYNTSGNYNLNLVVNNSDGVSVSKTYRVFVNTPKNTANNLLSDRKRSLTNITTQINKLSEFDNKSLRKLLNLSFINYKLNELQRRYDSAGDNITIYNGIINELNSLEIPQKLSSVPYSSTKFIPDQKHIKLNVLKSIGGGDYNSSKREHYIRSINNWIVNNLDVYIGSVKYSVEYNKKINKDLYVYTLTIEDSPNVTSFLIMFKSGFANLEFDRNYSSNKQHKGGYVGIELNQSVSEIKFSTTRKYSQLTELPIFISPSLDELILPHEVVIDDKTWFEKYWSLIFILIMIILAATGLGLHILIKQWYKKKYEDTLFQGNMDDLYNLLNYIGAAKEKMGDREIKKRLLEQGWKREQINYTMRKYYSDGEGPSLRINNNRVNQNRTR